MTIPRFLSLDGIDGTGKSTQCRLLADWLRNLGHQVTLCTDPGGTPLGAELRRILLHHRGERSLACEALLFMASRAQLVQEIIRPALASGHIVISDRYLLANVVYQGYGGGLDVELLWQAGRLSTLGLEPDLTFVLDLPLEAAMHRRGRPADRMESKGADHDERVRAGFLAEVAKQPNRLRLIDASGTIDEIQTVLRRQLSL